MMEPEEVRQALYLLLLRPAAIIVKPARGPLAPPSMPNAIYGFNSSPGTGVLLHRLFVCAAGVRIDRAIVTKSTLAPLTDYFIVVETGSP